MYDASVRCKCDMEEGERGMTTNRGRDAAFEQGKQRSHPPVQEGNRGAASHGMATAQQRAWGHMKMEGGTYQGYHEAARWRRSRPAEEEAAERRGLLDGSRKNAQKASGGGEVLSGGCEAERLWKSRRMDHIN